MNTSEITIWSAMMGGLITLALLSIADVWVNRTVASWRGLFFLIVTGSTSMVLCDLPSYLFEDISPIFLMVLRCSLGPLSGAISLNYLGLWLGHTAEDTRIGATIVGGSILLAVSAVVLGVIASTSPIEKEYDLLVFGAISTCSAVVMALYVSVRASNLGDPLARWMVVAGFFLAITVAGLFTNALAPEYMNLYSQSFTAFSVVAFVLVVVALTISRNRLLSKLSRLAGLAEGVDGTTGLPTGSVLMSKIDDALWRSTRTNGECAVICVQLRNLYELGEVAGHGVEHQILAAMSARIRRAVGFRCVVGLYHPRCFVVVISAAKVKDPLTYIQARLRHLVPKPLAVVGLHSAYYNFAPRFSIGTVTTHGELVDSTALIDEAERLALGHESEPRDDLPTTMASLTESALQ
jgi:GGDEF domain-containing protein